MLIGRQVCGRILISVVIAISAFLGAGPARADGPEDGSGDRWRGHPFAFVLMTDDGTRCNLGWAEVARTLGFRFTIAVNAATVSPRHLSAADIRSLHSEGFEIANHSFTHGVGGVAATCPTPPRGSLQAYFDCPDLDPVAANAALQAEISCARVESTVGLPAHSVRTLAYPRHLHSKALIDVLVDEGYIGARFGGNDSYSSFSGGDFTVPARNSWEGGISLFRVPVAQYATVLFGNHSANPAVHFTHQQFFAATEPLINQARQAGGIFVIYAHHYGDHDDTWGDINYGSSGMTPTDLAWLVELVRANDGEIMTFGEAVSYFRARSVQVDMDGDLVWVPGTTAVEAIASVPTAADLRLNPNPCNGGTEVQYQIRQAGPVRLSLYDLRGQLAATLFQGWREPGQWSVEWGGRLAGGPVAPSGTYFVRIESADGSSSGKLTLLK